ncbi:MAG: hypothetical protein K2O61_03385, partial [Bacteroidaceae bacterium]|nr:hypothetical protein [Bacteroidaceae bacterium]
MYKLEELNRKEKEELVEIAAELGIKNANKMDETELRLTIIDEQAANFASTAATEKATRKRTRVSVKNVDRVYSANQAKVKKIDKTMKVTKDESLFADLSDEEKAMLTPATATQEEAPAATQNEPVAATPKKRGRKPKALAEAEKMVETQEEEQAETPQEPVATEPKKRGRKPKVKVEEETENTADIQQETPA